MDYNELKQAAKVFFRIRLIRGYVSRERFDIVAKTQFGINDERRLDVMYGLLNMTDRLIYYIANEDNEKARKETRWPEYIKLIPQAIDIAETAFALKDPDDYSGSLPVVEYTRYRQQDMRRYFYQEHENDAVIDVDLRSKDGIKNFGNLLQREGVKIKGVARHLGYLEGIMNANHCREKFQYFDGDIYFLFADPTDRVFYDWFSHGNDAGVYMATDKGWRKLLYTPGRGYIDNKNNVQFVDERNFSDYMLEKSGMGFRYVGNIYQDYSVLREKRKD